MEYDEFIRSVKNTSGKRKSKICNSYGVVDYYGYYRKSCIDKGEKAEISLGQFSSMIRRIDELLCKDFENGDSIRFPCRMGVLELRKYRISPRIENGKTVCNSPVDWNKTLRMWFEDEDARKRKLLVKLDSKYGFKVCYVKATSTFRNKCFYRFRINREVRKAAFENWESNKVDAPLEKFESGY